jgi:hypothetical protein
VCSLTQESHLRESWLASCHRVAKYLNSKQSSGVGGNGGGGGGGGNDPSIVCTYE